MDRCSITAALTDPDARRREEDDKHQDGGPVAAADHADDDDGDQRFGQSDHEVDPSHDDGVRGAAQIAGEKPQHGRDRVGTRGDHGRTDQRRPGAMNHAGEHVATEEHRSRPDAVATEACPRAPVAAPTANGARSTDREPAQITTVVTISMASRSAQRHRRRRSPRGPACRLTPATLVKRIRGSINA